MHSENHRWPKVPAKPKSILDGTLRTIRTFNFRLQSEMATAVLCEVFCYRWALDHEQPHLNTQLETQKASIKLPKIIKNDVKIHHK